MKKKTFLMVILSIVLILAMLNTSSTPPRPVSATSDAKIIKIDGTVAVQKQGTTKWVQVKEVPYSLEEGDKVQAGKGSGAEITINSNKVKVEASSTIELQKQKDPETGIWKWVVVIIIGTAFLLCIAGFADFWVPPVAVILITTCIVLGAVGVVIAVEDALSVSAFRETVLVQSFDEHGLLIAQTNITGSLGLYADGTAWASGQQVSLLDDGTISEHIEVSLSPSEAMELYEFVYGDDVGGIIQLPDIEESGAAIPDLSGHNHGTLAGIIAGAAVGVIMLIGAVWYVRRRRTKAT